MTYTDKEVAAVAWAANAELQAVHGDPDPSLPGDVEDAEAHAVTVAGIRAILGGATPGGDAVPLSLRNGGCMP